MGADCRTQISKSAKKGYFSISTDGSADRGGKKQLCPVVIRHFSEETQKVQTEVLGVPAIEKDSTGENIFELMNNEIKHLGLDWNKCICFCSDNASVMMGRKKGVAAFVQQEFPNCFIMRCTCHLVAITARRASKHLPVSVEDLLIHILLHMKGTSKRSREMSEL